MSKPIQRRRPLAGGFDFMVRGARPAGLWVCVIILFVHGVVLPIANLSGHHGASLDWKSFLGLVGLLGLGWHQRTREKQEGLTS